MSDDARFDAELRALLAEGRKIEAIKRYREATGAGLAEAKEAVEALERGEAMPTTQSADSALETEIISLLEAGRKVEAIKLYRERTGTGLKEAKDAVEAIAGERRIPSRVGCLGVVLGVVLISLVASAWAAEPATRKARLPQEMKLWKEIDIRPYKGSFPCLGDLDGDGRVDFLLYRQGPQTMPGYMVALNHDGKKLWEMGDPSIKSHVPDGAWKEPALRGIAFIYDIDQDGKSEAITEFWKDGRPMLYVLDGATGKIKHSRDSPFSLDIRGGRRSRCHPVGRIAHLQGRDKPPAVVLVYGASNFAPGQVVALDAGLHTLWQRSLGRTSVAHVPTVADINGDGRDEIVAGTALVGPEGNLLWEKTTNNHADCTAVVDFDSGKAVLMSICNTGPAYCLSPQGRVVWKKTTKEVSHGQGIWVGNFIDK
jgi:ribosomal protein L7/L12